MISKQGIEQTRPDVATHDTDIKADIGDFSGQANLQSLLAVLGWPDVSGETVFKELITDRLDEGSYGLNALKTLLDSIPTTMVGTDAAFLANVGGLLDTATATGAVSSAKLVMAYIKQLVTEGIARDIVIGTIPTTMVGTNSAATVADGWDVALATILDNFTAARIGYLDELDFDLTAAIAAIPTTMVGTDSAMLATSGARILNSLDFWSDVGEEVVVTGTQSTVTAGLNNVVVADLPAGATIVRAVVMMKFRMVENIYAGVNKLDAASALPMQLDDVANTGMLTCLDFADDLFSFLEAAREGGDIVIGDIDVSTRVDANDTYDFQWLNAKADQNNIQFNEVQMGIRIWYSV